MFERAHHRFPSGYGPSSSSERDACALWEPRGVVVVIMRNQVAKRSVGPTRSRTPVMRLETSWESYLRER